MFHPCSRRARRTPFASVAKAEGTMVQRTYTTTMRDPEAFFASLEPFRALVMAEQQRYRPFGPHYCMLSVIVSALDAAAVFFTKNRAFYSIGDSAKVGAKRT